MSKNLKIVLLLPLLWCVLFVHAQDTIPVNTTYSFEVTEVEGYTYKWWYTDVADNVFPMNSTSHQTEEYLWNTEGRFKIFAQAQDTNNCLSEVIFEEFVVADMGADLIVSAGMDTTIGSCSPYRLQAYVSRPNGLSYLWSPADNLDNPTLLNPVFTPGLSTTFILTVSDIDGLVKRDTVEIEVSDILADAGEDFTIEEGSTALLNGMGSAGEQIVYSWTTENGSFVGGEHTATPEISSTGTYHLTVTDTFGCYAYDSVVVSRYVYAPIARDVEDTVVIRKSVTIDVLANDEDPQGELDPSSLQIVKYPLSGTVVINIDGTITYTPNDGFTGEDVFEYTICNYFEKCDNANVYVYVVTPEFFIPEAFTPNGDGINDYFEIVGIETYETNSLVIINRWGKKVYEAQNYGISTNPLFWDGRSNKGGGNAELPTGTYFYVLELGNGEPPIAGSIYIDR